MSQPTVVATLPIVHGVDTATGALVIGQGWVILTKGLSSIERVLATLAQDGVRGAVMYDNNNSYVLDGQRLIKIGLVLGEAKFEYPFEHLPDGTVRYFGQRPTDQKSKSSFYVQHPNDPYVRVWAIAEHRDPFSNCISFDYGGNDLKNLSHNKCIQFMYDEVRSDKNTRYQGSYKILVDKRMKGLENLRLDNQETVLNYDLAYAEPPLTKLSCLTSLGSKGPNDASTYPLNFIWNHYPNADIVFDYTRDLVEISSKHESPEIIPLDVGGNGSHDLVVMSKNGPLMNFEVYSPDKDGKILSTPAISIKKFDYPDQILCLNLEGNGIADLVFITRIEEGHFYRLQATTIKTSTCSLGEPSSFPIPEQNSGIFHSDDFSGDGKVGIVYIYGAPREQLKKSSEGTGPVISEEVFTKMQVIVGDLDGNGVQDIFLFYPRIEQQSWAIVFIESVSGKLDYNKSHILSKTEYPYVECTVILPFLANGDGKTSLLFVSKNRANMLQLQLLRSTGPTFLIDNHFDTSISYNDRMNVFVNHITSASMLDVAIVVHGPKRPRIHILQFDSNTFHSLDPHVAAHVLKRSLTRWTDLRGIGRSDCVFITEGDSHAFTIRSLSLEAHSSALPTDRLGFLYGNARIDFNGRGWLGFETIERTSNSLQRTEKTTHIQNSPLTGQLHEMKVMEQDRGVLQLNTYTWTSLSVMIHNMTESVVSLLVLGLICPARVLLLSFFVTIPILSSRQRNNSFSKWSTYCDSNNQTLTRKMMALPNGGINIEVDGLGRLTTIEKLNGVALKLSYDGISETNKEIFSPQGTEKLCHYVTTYDDNNHRWTLSNELTGVDTSTTSDLLGRQISREVWIFRAQNPKDVETFEYYQDQLAKVTSRDGPSYEYTYDDYGNVTSFLLIKLTLPDGQLRIYPCDYSEVDLSNINHIKETRSYLIHNGRRLACNHRTRIFREVTKEKVHHPQMDHIGNTVGVSNDRGEILGTFEYHPFGMMMNNIPRNRDEPIVRYTFSGKEMFDDLYYFGARYYDPQAGRFLTLDTFPIDLDNITSSSFNLYGFAGNNPVNVFDLNGDAPVPWWHW
ncbi:hypothetical protein AMATHDRAFT_3186 [Amanita thiersii Skay4041]|uniref:Insecticide toxin TcdB middle/N-terminal domain-containing protein n=1 Tax=Amanita thiersii Skay4041 TaxID=703135 RepID=A0A2A9NSU9_9AGAR|nr:hypothetical protein AMATHDRAFT_3186 [Amanita thiersii Skay4041]